MSRSNRFSRRAALQAGLAGGLFGAMSRTSFSMAPSWMQSSNSDKMLVVFLRGGYDCVNTIVPHGDTDYNNSVGRRPTLWMAPGVTTLPILNNSFCELNPALSQIVPLVNSGRLVFAHATGNPARTGSHFEDQRTWETAITPCGTTTLDPEEGWVTRAVSELFPGGFKAASVSNGLQQFFRTRPDMNGAFNPDRVLPHVKALRDFPGDTTARYTLDTSKPLIDAKLRGTNAGGPMIGLRALFTSGTQATHTKDAFARRVGEAMLDSETAIAGMPSAYMPLGGAQYPFGAPGSTALSPFPFPSQVGLLSDSNNIRRFFMYLRDAMALLRLIPEVRCVGIELASFDTHSQQKTVNGSGVPEGQLQELLNALAFGLKSIDMEEQDSQFEPASLTTIVCSEFGRTSAENTTAGTDHGGASAMWIAGSRARAQAGGDPIYNANSTLWPGLFSANNSDFGCPPITPNAAPKNFIQVVTDFRAVFGEALRDIFGANNTQIDRIIPGYLAANLQAQELGCIN